MAKIVDRFGNKIGELVRVRTPLMGFFYIIGCVVVVIAQLGLVWLIYSKNHSLTAGFIAFLAAIIISVILTRVEGVANVFYFIAGILGILTALLIIAIIIAICVKHDKGQSWREIFQS